MCVLEMHSPLSTFFFPQHKANLWGRKVPLLHVPCGLPVCVQCTVCQSRYASGGLVWQLSQLYQFSLFVLPSLQVSWYQNIPVSLKPYQLYPILAVSYVGAMVASNSSLAYITYPTQVHMHRVLKCTASVIVLLVSANSCTT